MKKERRARKERRKAALQKSQEYDETAGLSAEDEKFLNLVHSPILYPNLLARLQALGLLSSFLEAANETIPRV